VTFKSVATLDLKVKTRSDCKTDIKFEILDPENHKNDILHDNRPIGQTTEKGIFKMSDGGHFGFLPITAYAHTFERGTPPILLFNLQRRQNN